MSEVISPPGTTEPVFGLQIFNEELVFVDQLPDGTVTVDASSLTTDATLVAEDPLDTTSYFAVTGSGNDTVITAAGDDEIFTRLGDDIVFAGLGDDIVFGGDGNDRIFGSGGDDELFGGAGDDRLLGGAGDDTLAGGAGDDVVRGGAGSDTIIAGAGRDTLVGGAGPDVFRFGRGANNEIDQIVDFDPSEDIVELRRGLLPGSGLSGTLTAADFATVTTLGSGSDAKIIYESSTGLVYYNSGRAGSTPVALLNLGKDLSVSADAFQIV
ncbi:MAG: hypothetical protein KME07_01970 [Pegethrix bostrychoides GSE-TBD4-15B]|jgi:Ca2+-binding RTX toxin-like protein|uniref:Calcium-binding protein n=1 Tax=Pegethrix bostrychoides GSE-TBD4-15B TaxID=2839662 RepID=A0A951U3A3_9CYAN|nr:hypothetical protein [Pegethrix bostrychoides GSE-TBD4-15B]